MEYVKAFIQFSEQLERGGLFTHSLINCCGIDCEDCPFLQGRYCVGGASERELISWVKHGTMPDPYNL